MQFNRHFELGRKSGLSSAQIQSWVTTSLDMSQISELVLSQVLVRKKCLLNCTPAPRGREGEGAKRFGREGGRKVAMPKGETDGGRERESRVACHLYSDAVVGDRGVTDSLRSVRRCLPPPKEKAKLNRDSVMNGGVTDVSSNRERVTCTLPVR